MMKNNRIFSFVIIFIVYILAAICGILVYRQLNYDLWLNIFIADVVATVVVFLFSLIFNNASVYDPYWSVQPIVIVVALMFEVEFSITKLFVIIPILFWGIRLTANWAYTFKSLNHQDWRYTMLKEKTGVFYPIINFIGIHMIPTIIVYLCTMPAVYVLTNYAKFSVWTVIFAITALGSATLQGVADIQMHKFRKNKNSVFIRNGLWKYSRHPNYLGEILMWWSIGLLSVLTLMDMPYLIVGAIANTLLFLFVSIPMAEKNQASRKEGFLEYKKKTRMLLPIKK